MLEKLDKFKIDSPQELEGFANLDPLQSFGATNLNRLLNVALQKGVIGEEHIRGKVVDFGCGNGGSSWYLEKLGADVTALDLEDMAELRQLGILPAEKIISGNGIEYLNRIPESSLDMIVAVMFGPDIKGDLSRKFLPAAKRAIKQNGSILIISEIGTLQMFDAIAQGSSFRLDGNSRFVVKVNLGEGISPVLSDGRLIISLGKFSDGLGFKENLPLFLSKNLKDLIL